MLRIGDLQLKSKYILAPMAGVSDLPFRMLNRRFGCALAFVEMINCRSISHKSRRTRQMLKTNSQDRPLGIQLLGCEPEFILRSLDVLKEYAFDILDFNAACPAKKVTRRGEGASLLKEPKKMQKLLKLLVKNSTVPVTLKIRTGWDRDSVNAQDVASSAQDAGISALFIHGRTKLQGYSGEVDYPTIRQVKNSLKIPVIASGDLFSPVLVKKMFDETGCDAVAIARGTLGNPWIFPSAQGFIEDGLLTCRPGVGTILETMVEHLEGCIAFYGERVGVVKFRKFFSWYTKGFRKIRPLREKSSRAKTRNDMLGIINACYEAIKTKNPESFGVLL